MFMFVVFVDEMWWSILMVFGEGDVLVFVFVGCFLVSCQVIVRYLSVLQEVGFVEFVCVGCELCFCVVGVELFVIVQKFDVIGCEWDCCFVVIKEIVEGF